MPESRCCCIESLETRKLFAATGIKLVGDIPLLITPLLVSPPMPVSGLSGVTLVNGTLTVTGTHKADKITLTRQTDGFVRALQDPQNVGNQTRDGQIKIVFNSTTTISGVTYQVQQHDVYVLTVGKSSYAIKTDGINKIVINGGDGNDTIRIAKNVRTQTTVNGGAGDDILEAGRKNDILNGNAGDDTLVGSFDSNSFNRYRGGEGKDKLIGHIPSGPLGTFNSIEQIVIA